MKFYKHVLYVHRYTKTDIIYRELRVYPLKNKYKMQDYKLLVMIYYGKKYQIELRNVYIFISYTRLVFIHRHSRIL